MNNRRNFYRLLQVQPDAPEAIIRASYRTLMQKLRMHPDLGGDTDYAALLNQAYQTLIDKHKRASYDRQLKRSASSQRTRAAEKKPSPNADKPAQPKKARKTQKPSDNNTHKPLSICPFCRTSQPRLNRYGDDRRCANCHSPLQLPEKRNSYSQGKRSIYRINHNGSIYFVSNWPQTHAHLGTIDDLSPNGLQLRCRQSLAQGSVLKLYNANLQAIGRVARCQPDAVAGYYRLGIEFITLHFENKTGSFLSTSA